MNFEVKNLIDYFVVCGLDINSGLEPEPNEIYYSDGVSKPPLERAYKSKILNHFPTNLPWNPFDVDAVTQLCLPKGLVFYKNYHKPSFHPFVITREDGSRIFGATFTFLEHVQDDSICSAMQTLQTMYDAENSNSKQKPNQSLLSQSHNSNNGHNCTHSATLQMKSSALSIQNHHYRSASASMPTTHSRNLTNIALQSSNRYNALARQCMVNTTPVTTKTGNFKKFSDFQDQNLLRKSSDESLSILENELQNYSYIYSKTQEHSPMNINSNQCDLLESSIGSNLNSTYGDEYLNLNSSIAAVHLNSDLSHYNMFKDRLYSSKCICLISQNPFNKSFKKILNTLYDMVEQTDLLGINLESHLYNIIYELPMPENGRLMQFHVGCRASIVYMPDYLNANDLPLLDYDLSEFFQLLSVQDIVSFYTAALLEHQILLYSKDYYLLMLVAESLTALFFPFTWLKPYVPIVPASNLHFIEAPVPYIMGFHHKDIDKEFFTQGQRCFVDIDCGTVSCPEGLPEFPDKNKFCRELNELIEYFNEKKSQSKIRSQLKLNKTDPGYSSYKSSLTNMNPDLSSLNSEENISNDILKNSQAFLRITELARKAGAFNNSDTEEYSIDKSTGRVKTTNRDSSSSGVSSVSSVVNTESSKGSSSESKFCSNSDQLDKSENNSFETLPPVNNEGGSNSFASAINEANLSKNLVIDEQELISMQFTRCVRELFLQKFVEIFMTYEKYVIVPNIESTNIESWWTSREYTGNFDSKMFLIEQPSPRLPFLSHFIGTQMFASFIDLKIITIIEKKSPDPKVKIFDEKIKSLKENDLNMNDPQEHETHTVLPSDSVIFKASLDIKTIENQLLKAMSQVPKQAPTVRKLNKRGDENGFRLDFQSPTDHVDIAASLKIAQQPRSNYLFEQIDTKLLKADEEFIKRVYREMKIQKESQAKKRDQFENNNLQLKLRKVRVREKRNKKQNNDSKNSENIPVTPIQDTTEKISTELNPVFIQSLLKESKLKTKRMLVEKMPEAIHLGHGECRISGVEENMLIASLCDLIERIWGHGLHNKPGKSALWNHLTNYRKLIQYLKPNGHVIDPKTTSPRFSSIPRKRQTLSLAAPAKNLQTPSPKMNMIKKNLGSASNLQNLFQNQVNQLTHKRASSVSHNENPTSFTPIANDLLGDLSRIDKLTEVKTEIGMARAFVRLSLEKKLLADHLRKLLDEGELLRALYKKHAFLRQEDEREQFIYHLQSLNVVDHFCFTNYFKSISTDYSVILVPSKRINSSNTSANPHIKLFGTLDESNIIPIPKHTFQFVISCNSNLGPLTTLSIGHDNAGMTPKWMIECVYVRNETTGHIHKFPCGRWLGRGIDDDSLERLLIAHPVSHMELQDLSSVNSMSPYSDSTNRSRSPIVTRNEEKKVPSSALVIQENLGNSINSLLKFFERPESDKYFLTSLMCGEGGLVNSMENIFLFGFRSYKLFKRLFIWDFLEKAAYEFEGTTYSKFLYSPPPCNTKSIKSTDRFTNTIREINTKSAHYGKDGKFQIFICLACRNSLLTDWFLLLSRSNSASQMYDEDSFIRNFELNKFCLKIMSITNQFDFKLEKSLTMGINPIN